MHALPSQNLFMVSWALTVTFFSCCYTDMVLNYSRQYSARLELQNLFLFIPRVNGTVETEFFDMSTSLVKYGKSSFTEIKYPWHAESYDLKVLFAESWSQDLVSRLLKIKYFTCKVLKCLRLYAESTTIFFSFFFFFWGGGQECSLEQCCNKFETTWESCDAECQAELLFVPSNFPIKIRCLWKLALILMAKFLCSLRCRCLKSRMTHIQRHSSRRKLFYSCFSFPVLSCWSMKRDNRKPQSLDLFHFYFCRWSRTRATFSPKKPE